MSALEQQQLLDCAERQFSPFDLLYAHELTVEHILGRQFGQVGIGFSDDVNERDMEQIRLGRSRVDEDRATQRIVAQAVTNDSAEPLEQRLARMDPDGGFLGFRSNYCETFASRGE